jgi:hypothetical protein
LHTAPAIAPLSEIHENHARDVDRRCTSASGRVISPVVVNQAPYDHLGVAPDRVQSFRADAFYWSSDRYSLAVLDSAIPSAA